MAKTSAQRVRETRDRHRQAGLRPVQIWVPDTGAPGFAAEAAHQSRQEARWANSKRGREELAFWEALAAEAWQLPD
jgi:hypothetical protein